MLKIKSQTRNKTKKSPLKRIKVKAEGKEAINLFPKIKIIGIGGGGNSIVSEIAGFYAKNGHKGKNIDFIALNTDFQDLARVSRRCKTIKLGRGLTNGLGCGMDCFLGEKAAQEAREEIKKNLTGADLCILVSSLGGGFGSGAVPVLAEICRELKITSLGVFTLPFDFEGEKKREIVRYALRKASFYLNALNIIPNEKMFQLSAKPLSLKSALSSINQRLAFSLEGLIKMIYETGLINIDWADFKAILDGREKRCYLNRVELSGEDRANKAVREVVSNPLNEYGLGNADRILFNIESDKGLKMREVDQISKFIASFNKKTKIIFGISLPFCGDTSFSQGLSKSFAQKDSNKIGITLLATGGKGLPEFFSKKTRDKFKVSFLKNKEAVQAQEKSSEECFSKGNKNGTEEKGKNAPYRDKGAQSQKRIRHRTVLSGKNKQNLSRENKFRKDKTSNGKKRDIEEKEAIMAQSVGRVAAQKRNEAVLPDCKQEESVLTGGLRQGVSTAERVKKNSFRKFKKEHGKKSENSYGSRTIRKNALTLRKEVVQAEKEILAAEKKWDIPAFLRKNQGRA